MISIIPSILAPCIGQAPAHAGQTYVTQLTHALWPHHGIRRTLDLPCECKAGFTAFRSTADPLRVGKGDVKPAETGLADLCASGSSEFTPNGLAAICAALPTGHGVLDVDIRQESHGYDGHRALGWWKADNSGNANRSLAHVEQAEKTELTQLNRLPRGATYVAYRFDAQEVVGERVRLRAGGAYDEATLAMRQGIAYARIPMSDRAPHPPDASVDLFVARLFALEERTWVHFHCLHGHGRTTLYMAMYDMLRNADRVSVEAIILRQFLLGGVDLRRKTLATHMFLQRFHAYARACLQAQRDRKPVPSWSTWHAQLSEHQTLLRFIDA